MSYGQTKEFIAKHTKLIELTDGDARVIVCPEWQGRVMTSTCSGEKGLSFGFVHCDFIEDGKLNPHFNNYGGEDRMWLSPEGGQFSLWFKPGVEQDLSNWFTPKALNEGGWEVASDSNERCCRMATQMKCQNASATEFDLAVSRDVKLVDRDEIKKMFGDDVAELATENGAKMVGYETVNSITNNGRPMSKDAGLVSIWILGMLNASPETVIIVPYKSGSEEQLGPTVKSDYFGVIPADRLKITPDAILLKGDSKFRSKIGTSQRRTKNVLGSIDFKNGVLTIVSFTMPEDPTTHDYMNNMWDVPQSKPYAGDVANCYNDGPPAPDKKGLGEFYEIESLSPAVALKTKESLKHSHRTIHIQADMPTLVKLADLVLGVDLEKIRTEMTTR